MNRPEINYFSYLHSVYKKYSQNYWKIYKDSYYFLCFKYYDFINLKKCKKSKEIDSQYYIKIKFSLN